MLLTRTKTAKLVGASREVIRKHLMLWFAKQEIRAPGKKRGQGSAHYGCGNHILKHEHLSEMAKFVDSNNRRAGAMASIRSIRDFLLRKYGVRYNRSTIYFALCVTNMPNLIRVLLS